MSSAISEQVHAALSRFTSDTRLYALRFHDESLHFGDGELMVEAFAADELLQGCGVRDVIVLSTDAGADLSPCLGQLATLEISLADRSRASMSGYVSAVGMLGSNGGLARFRVRLSPWLYLLTQTRNSRVWQEKSVMDIVDSVFQQHGFADWSWSDETAPFMEGAGVRSYCCQYRESDYDFVRRLLTEEGLSWRFEDHEDGQRMVIFADSTQHSAVPEDASSAAGGGIRYHGARVGEKSDTIQMLHTRQSIASTSVSMVSYDYKAKQVVGSSVPNNLISPGGNIPELESYDVPGQYAFSNGGQAQRYTLLRMQALEARVQQWQLRSTVRTLRAGTRFTLNDAPFAAANGDYAVLRVLSVGVNNLPAPAKAGLIELFGPLPELLQDSVSSLDDLPRDFEQVIAKAMDSGYANSFDALATDRPWRPLANALGAPARPTALGSQSAIVIGADGADRPNGADELYCDQHGRVRIRFHWQDTGDATCWVRVAQRAAGGGMGSQFLPRIGQEVLIQFLEGDIDRPIIIGALYNGQGEGGIQPTPAGQGGGEDTSAVFKPAHDHATSGQGNLIGGHSPVWHGAAAPTAGHRNTSAQWGVRSKEFGGSGYNQLLFDDTDAQGRVQLRSTHGATELTLGHLLHQADNFRGSLRGQGAELRTDHYGALRGGAGLLITSYPLKHAADAREPAGDNAPGMAMLKQAMQLGAAFSDAAVTHETVGFASHLGAQKANASLVDPKMAPLKAVWTAAAGMLNHDSIPEADDDAFKRNVAPAKGKVPHTSGPLLEIAARAGLSLAAGQDVQLANGETANLMSGKDTQFITGNQMRLHTGQAIGFLGGAVKPGEGKLGFQMIAAEKNIEFEAQSDVIKVQARDDIKVLSANAHIDWAAAKSISLSTAAGANITIEGGNITIQCPGKITVHAGKKSFLPPDSMSYPMPQFGICEDCILKAALQGSPFTPR